MPLEIIKPFADILAKANFKNQSQMKTILFSLAILAASLNGVSAFGLPGKLFGTKVKGKLQLLDLL